ncbi:MAG: hypothetical protein Q8P22_02460 [Chloroflexota bacterium]|nr:hypothetical protein [Chloroflexota bacterium]
MKRFALAMGALALLGVGLTLAGAACGDGGEGEATPTAASPSVPAGVKAVLEQMVLQPGEVPAGFTATEQVFGSNEQVAAESADPQAELAKLQRWGRIWGYEVTYEPGGTAVATATASPGASQVIVFSVNSAVSLYESAEGASASFAEAAQAARSTDWPALFTGATDLQVQELSAPGLADEVLWLRITAKAEAREQTFAQDVVLLRQGPNRGTLQVAMFGVAEEGRQLVERMARAQVEHMASAAP